MVNSYINNLSRFCNTHLPVPRLSLDQLMKRADTLAADALIEVRKNLEQLTEEEICLYGHRLDRRLEKQNSNVYEIGREWPYKIRVDRTYPDEDLVLLQHENSDIQDFLHELCFKAHSILDGYFSDLDIKIWKLHPLLEKGRYQV